MTHARPEPQAAPVASGEHTEREDHGWAVYIPDHPARTESEGFRRAKEAAHKILATVPDGSLIAAMAAKGSVHPAPVQAHHAGSLWVHDGTGWFVVLNAAGVEWSAQWSADPAKVDGLRAAAQRLYAGFPQTLDELDKLGYTEAREILSTPITDHAGVARWTDSLFNSCVMLSPLLHQSIVSAEHPVGGWHHFPKSIWDIQLTKRDDFRLWVIDAEGHPAAVAPMAHPGSGDARVQVLWAHPSSALHAAHQEAHAAGQPLVLDESHPLAVQAFAAQSA